MRTPVETPYTKLNRKAGKTACSRGDSLIGPVNDYFRDLLLFSNILYEELYIFFVRTRRTKLTFAFEWQVTTYDQTRSLNLPSFLTTLVLRLVMERQA